MNEQRIAKPRSRRGRFAPVTTYYTGTRFERRLEARWAAFLATANIPYRYYSTRESPDTGSIFLLAKLDNSWLVTQPRLPTPDGVRRLRRYLATGAARDMAILFGRCRAPWTKHAYGGFSWWRNEADRIGEYVGIYWQECVWCEEVFLVPTGSPCPQCGQVETLSDSTERLERAYKLAASIRFPAPVRAI